MLKPDRNMFFQCWAEIRYEVGFCLGGGLNHLVRAHQGLGGKPCRSFQICTLPGGATGQLRGKLDMGP